MLIQVDQEGAQAVATVCDALLKRGGLQMIPYVTKVMGSMKLVEIEEGQPRVVKLPGAKNDGETQPDAASES